jgi:hypothetical protein
MFTRARVTTRSRWAEWPHLPNCRRDQCAGHGAGADFGLRLESDALTLKPQQGPLSRTGAPAKERGGVSSLPSYARYVSAEAAGRAQRPPRLALFIRPVSTPPNWTPVPSSPASRYNVAIRTHHRIGPAHSSRRNHTLRALCSPKSQLGRKASSSGSVARRSAPA